MLDERDVDDEPTEHEEPDEQREHRADRAVELGRPRLTIRGITNVPTSFSTSKHDAADDRGGQHRAQRDPPADDQRLHRLGALERVDRLDVGHVAHHVVLEQDAVAAEQVAGLGDHPARLARVVELRQARDRVRHPPRRLEASELHAVELHRRDLCEHLDEAVLDDLKARQRLAELLALQRVA